MVKHLLSFLILLLPLCVLGQSNEADQYFYKGVAYESADQPDKAIPYFEKSAELEKKIFEPSSDNYHRSDIEIVKCKFSIVNNYISLQNYNEAIKLQTNVVESVKQIVGEEDEVYATMLNNLSYVYKLAGNYDEAIKLGSATLDIRRKVLGEKHPNYAASLVNMKYYCSESGKYEQAIIYATQLADLYKVLYGENSKEYGVALSDLAKFYAHLRNYDASIRIQNKVTEIFKQVFGSNSLEYAVALSNLASLYHSNHNFGIAAKMGVQASELVKSINGEQSLEYATSLSNLSVYYSSLENYSEAIKLETKAAEIRKKLLGENHKEYGSSLGHLSALYSCIGNTQESIRYAIMSSNIFKVAYGPQSRAYATALHRIANGCADLKHYDDAIKLMREVLNILKQEVGEYHPEYADAVSTIAKFHSEVGNINDAIQIENKVLQIYKKAYGEENFDYLSSLITLALYNHSAGNYSESMKYENIATDILKKSFPEEKKLTVYLRFLSAINSLMTGNGEKAKQGFSQFYDYSSSFVMSNFSTMSSFERLAYWFPYNSAFYTFYVPRAAFYYPCSTFNSMAYNGQVLSKGLLLNAELEIQKLIDQKGDTALANRFAKIQHNRVLVDSLTQVPFSKRTMNADSLSQLINKDERMLVESLKELGDYTKNLSIDWKTIQKKLTDQDIAIEFATFNDTTNQIVYIALVLKKGMKYPELVKLFESKDFNKITKKEYYVTNKLYDIVWKPLEKYLQGVKNVYFAPSCDLHNIGIEYLPDANGNIFDEQYNVYRLSSTRELAITHTVNAGNKAATYGGIHYSNDADSTNQRSNGPAFLIGTKLESEAVAKILKKADYDVTVFSGTTATEESLKNLSGNGYKILHIGTHGFYYADNVLENSVLGYLVGGGQNAEDRAMSCSGLLFSGAKASFDPLSRQSIPEGMSDGILTAKEISRLDFKGLDLVVLSACQSGLGDITGEGVFGLQRGFKKAGAHTIIMSLWSVSDEATQMLMTEFFKNLTLNNDKRAAFVKAQATVRKKYSNPSLWAAFVMIDGI